MVFLLKSCNFVFCLCNCKLFSHPFRLLFRSETEIGLEYYICGKDLRNGADFE